MYSSLAVAAAFISLLILAPAKAQAQEVLASGNVYALASPRNDPDKAVVAEPEENLVIAGKITNPAGVLPGAVIILTATRQMAVTNAEGEFEFVVPASAGPLRARVTYAGYSDELMTLNAGATESTVNLANATVVVVARRQQLKTYLKTARKQVRRALKQARR